MGWACRLGWHWWTVDGTTPARCRMCGATRKEHVPNPAYCPVCQDLCHLDD